MHIPCSEIVDIITKQLKERVSALSTQGKSIKLLAVLVGSQPEQESYVRIKRKLAETLGIGFKFLHFPHPPPFDEFLQIITEESGRSDISGVIIQLPLPKEYDQNALYKVIPPSKEIEGHTDQSTFLFPLVQACSIGLNWIYDYPSNRVSYTFPFHLSEGCVAWLKNKHITIAGRGMTTGKPIAQYFDSLGIPFTQTHSHSVDSDDIYLSSDIIICGVGKKIITHQNVRKGVILLNFGLHKAIRGVDSPKHLLVGDYDEEEISGLAAWYTKTPGGLGPIDILCLYGNLIESTSHDIETRKM